MVCAPVFEGLGKAKSVVRMIRIAEGVWPDEVKEANYFSRGEYRIDEGATETMKNSLMYKMR